MENENEFFKDITSFIAWISAYYPAPGNFVSNDERMKNAESWEKFFERIGIYHA